MDDSGALVVVEALNVDVGPFRLGKDEGREDCALVFLVASQAAQGLCVGEHDAGLGQVDLFIAQITEGCVCHCLLLSRREKSLSVQKKDIQVISRNGNKKLDEKFPAGEDFGSPPCWDAQ